MSSSASRARLTEIKCLLQCSLYKLLKRFAFETVTFNVKKTVAKMLSLWFFKYPVFVSPNVRESKTVGYHAVDSGIQVLDSEFFVSATWIPDSAAKNSQIPESGFPYIRRFVCLLR